MGEEEDRLFDVVDVGDCEAGMVFCEVDDGVFAGDVGCGDDGVFVPGDGGVKGDGGDAAAGDGAADGGSEPHIWEGDVVDVQGAAQDFVSSFFADGGAADDLWTAGHRGYRGKRCIRIDEVCRLEERIVSGVPLPYGVYFGGKSFYLSDLHIEGARKIFNAKGLRAKYLFSIGWRLGLG